MHPRCRPCRRRRPYRPKLPHCGWQNVETNEWGSIASMRCLQSPVLDGIINAGVLSCRLRSRPGSWEGSRVPLNRFETCGRRSFGPRYKVATYTFTYSTMREFVYDQKTRRTTHDRQMLSLWGIRESIGKHPHDSSTGNDPVFRYN